MDTGSIMNAGLRAALLLALGTTPWFAQGCGDGGAGAEPDQEPELPCPSPGVGVEVGGNPGTEDATANPVRKVVLMGGGSEHDLAATRFVEGAGGGDVVILRASGSLTSYPGYFLNTLSPAPRPASVVTVKSTVPEAADDPAVLCWVGGGEAVWLAGGNQWDYLGGWPPELHGALVQASARGAAMGGTSAGAVSLGEAAFDARFGTVTSAEALADPLHPDVSVTYPSFALPELQGTLVDSHFMDRDREGRLLAFLARFLAEKVRAEVVGVGLDEGVALAIQDEGYQVYAPPGQSAWFYRVRGPAVLEAGRSLELAGILRAELDDGDTGAWPVDFDAIFTQGIRVRGGLVEVLASGQPQG